MPELPEVETVVRTLQPHIVGSFIQGLVPVYAPALHFFSGLDAKHLLGQQIQAVRRRGKLIILELAKARDQNFSAFSPSSTVESLLIFHLKMTGRLFVHDEMQAPLTHTRLVFSLEHKEKGEIKRTQLFFDDIRKFGYCKFLRPNQCAEWNFWRSLGLEPLDASEEELVESLELKKAKIKAVLLDQKIIAGVGNIYADEALFQAGIRPDQIARNLSYAQRLLLVQSLRAILQRAIQECGSSIRDYVDANGNAGSFQNNFFVYGRGGQECRVCSTRLSSQKVAGRTTVFCPSCQK